MLMVRGNTSSPEQTTYWGQQNKGFTIAKALNSILKRNENIQTCLTQAVYCWKKVTGSKSLLLLVFKAILIQEITLSFYASYSILKSFS